MARSNTSPRPRYAGDGHAVAGARVGPRQGPAADVRVRGEEAERHDGRVDRGLAVPQLPHVEVPLLAVEREETVPAQHDVAGRLHQFLPLDHPPALVAELAAAGEAFEHRVLSLLELQEEWVLVSRAEHQHHPRAGAHAADADDLASDLHEAIALEEVPAVIGQTLSVLGEELGDGLGEPRECPPRRGAPRPAPGEAARCGSGGRR